MIKKEVEHFAVNKTAFRFKKKSTLVTTPSRTAEQINRGFIAPRMWTVKPSER